MLFRSIEILGYVGNISPKLDISNFNIKSANKKVDLKGTIKNIGDRAGKFNLYLSDSKGNNKYFLGDFTILKDESIDLSDFNQEIKDERTLKILKNLNWIFIVDKESEKVTNKLSS